MTTCIRQTGALALAAAVFATGALGGGTKTWEHSSRAGFEQGKLDKLSLRSDGLLSLAPEFRELHDPSTNYLWAIAQDSKGNVYAGGSGQDNKARVFRVDGAGKGSVLAELAGLEVHAIAVDSQDRVYAATSPDGKVYRLRDGAQPQVYYDPKAKYIWALAFSLTGDLLVATGDKGEVHRVTGPGAGSVFFRTEESHARSMAVAKSGFVYVGTEPSGLIFRVSPAGEGFVLHQASKREITALAAAADGRIYAAAVGVKQPMAAPAAPAPPPAPAAAGAPARPAGPAPVASLGTTISGGSEVLRIEADGYPRKVWSHTSDIAYALAFDAAGKLLIGTGNRGAIHRLDTDLLNTLLLTASPTQVTGLAAGRDGAVFAVTGNIGKIYRLGPATEKTGTLESDAMDAGFFTQWGRLSYGGSENGGTIRLETHSGNLDSPRQNWSRWTQVPLQAGGGRVASPAARFLQYRLTLIAAASGKSPEVTSIEAAYLPKNVAPVVEMIEATPANYRFAASTAATPSLSITLPAIGSGAKVNAPGLATEATPSSMSFAKGQVGARWLVADDNGDSTLSTVEIRGAKETAWKTLRANQRERHISWDSTAFPDGDYYLRVRVTDSPSHPPDQALSNELQSSAFVIDNTPPKITGLSGTSNGSKIEVKWHASDSLNVMARAEYSLDGSEWKSVQPTTQLSDSRDHDYTLSIDGASAGEHTIAIRVTDAYENQAVEKVVVVR